MYNYKRLVGELLGAAISVVWISWALIVPENRVFLAIAISLTILLGVLSGGFLRLSKQDKESKQDEEKS